MHPSDTTPYSQTSNSSPHPIQKEVPPEPEEIDTEILDDLPDIINIPKELLSDFDSWHTVCLSINGNITFKSGQ